MVNKCQAPECNYNYESERKKRKSQPKWERISIFEFPKHKDDPERRRKWISRVPRVWNPKDDQSLFICEKHFRPEDIIRESTDTNSRRKRKKDSNQLYTKRYSDIAIPCIWPDAPSHLTNVTPSRVTTCATSELREENAQRYQEELENASKN